MYLLIIDRTTRDQLFLCILCLIIIIIEIRRYVSYHTLVAGSLFVRARALLPIDAYTLLLLLIIYTLYIYRVCTCTYVARSTHPRATLPD